MGKNEWCDLWDRTTADPLITPQALADEAERSRASIRYSFSSSITESIRRLDSGGSDGTAEMVAALHLLCLNAKIDAVDHQPLDEERSSEAGDRGSRESSSEASATDTQLLNGVDSSPLGALTFPDIIVKTAPHQSEPRNTVISLTSATLRRITEHTSSVDLCAKSGFLTDDFMAWISARTRTAQFPKANYVQAAAPYEAVVVEIVYKAIKLMLACAIILGSSGGAWLGLTLGSMFPQRVAAGLFVSSYGQKLSRTQITAQERPHAWRPAGTVWTEGPEPYLVPARGLSDAWRNAIGYVLQ